MTISIFCVPAIMIIFQIQVIIFLITQKVKLMLSICACAGPPSGVLETYHCPHSLKEIFHPSHSNFDYSQVLNKKRNLNHISYLCKKKIIAPLILFRQSWLSCVCEYNSHVTCRRQHFAVLPALSNSDIISPYSSSVFS